MDTIQYEYTKQRREFGHHPTFLDSAPLVDSVISNPSVDPQWLQSALTTVELDCIAPSAQHSVNTERFISVGKGTSHTDGAWPTEIKTNEFVDRQRYLRRMMNEGSYQTNVVALIRTAEQAIQSNNTIDLFQTYFGRESSEANVNGSGSSNQSGNTGSGPLGSQGAGGSIESSYSSTSTVYGNGGSLAESTYSSSPPSATTVCVFRDPNRIRRAATRISWHPDGAHKVAVSYSSLAFQALPSTATDLPTLSYIWDVARPNAPDASLVPSSTLTALVYNPRSPDHLVGGQYNGLVAFWDLRKGPKPVDVSVREKSHHDPVYDVSWIQSRTGNECASLSTDGQLLWWDVRKLKGGPTDSMFLAESNSKDNNSDNNSGPSQFLYGGTGLEYKSDAGATRYLVATEQGVVLLADRKAKKDSDSQKSVKAVYGANNGQHHGPIYSVQRNPFNLKYFLTVGDWTARIWMEDLRGPIMCSRYDKSYLTGGCWSPTRPGVFLTTKMDGTLDIWDYFHKQSEPTYSTKVCEGGLSSIRIQSSGKLVACGSVDGTTTVLQLSKGLYEPQKDEKSAIAALFERETKREKNLELRYLQRKRDQKEKDKEPNKQISPSHISYNDDNDDEETKEIKRKAEEDFYTTLDENKDDNSGNSTGVKSKESGGGSSGPGGAMNEEKEATQDEELEAQ